MLTPSYSELMDVIKKGGKVDNRVASRYTVVLAAARRARQLTEGAEPLTYATTDRAVSIAVKELNEGKLRVKVQDEIMDGSYERLVKDKYRYRAITALSKDDLREDLKDDYTSARTYKLEDEDDGGGDIFEPEVFEAVDADIDDEIVDVGAASDDDDELNADFDMFDSEETEESFDE